jgi:large subunit ribosomal protein L24
MAAKIKKGDKVVVLAGKDKGKTGEVLQVIPEESRALVQGINLVRRHTKQTASPTPMLSTILSSLGNCMTFL